MSEVKMGKNNPFYGKIHNDETRALMSKNHADFSGENAPNWKGGITSEDEKFRKSSEYAEWRKAVFERDNYTCHECGRRGGVVLNAHHILPVRDYRDHEYSLNIDNGITLCKECHDETKGKEYEFVGYFDIIIKEMLILTEQA